MQKEKRRKEIMMFGFNSKKKGYGFGVGMPGFGARKNSISNGNWDKDRKPNRGDCDPFNWKKQEGGEPFEGYNEIDDLGEYFLGTDPRKKKWKVKLTTPQGDDLEWYAGTKSNAEAIIDLERAKRENYPGSFNIWMEEA